jgi:hypothetical protein
MALRFPKMIDIERRNTSSTKLDFREVLSRQFLVTKALEQVKGGDRIAVAVGSRGITNLQTIVSSTLGELRAAGARPFIVPAMGSHGGATPEGQGHVLSGYGITEQTMWVPFDTRMDVRHVGTTEGGVEVFLSEAAMDADGIVLINRVKPHTDFVGDLGSGILKMIAVGLGKHRGALVCHAAASRLGHEAVIRAVSRVALRRAPILCGVAIVEDQKHETIEIQVLKPENVEEREGELFTQARSLMPTLPFDEIDLLIVDSMGKDVSGAGMDPNVIGRSVYGYSSSLLASKAAKPCIHRIFVRELTNETNGNAIGIGLADFTTTRAVRQCNLQVSYTNALTALTPSTMKIPIHFDTDRECIERSLVSLALPEFAAPRIVRILNTLSLDKLQVSEVFGPMVDARPDLSVRGSAHDMDFDHDGNMLSLPF